MSVAPSLGPGPAVLAFDVGGTSIKAALVDEAGAMRDVACVPTPAPGLRCGDEVLEVVAALVPRLSRCAGPGCRPQAIGLSVPGIVDDAAGVGVFSENLGWRDVEFGRLAAERFTVPTVVGHDVRSAGLAETTVGAAAGSRDVLVVVLGTGVAAVVLTDGRPVVGRGYAGEIGHTVVVRGGEACVCGNQGCLEAVASAAAITRRYNRAAGADVSGAREVLRAAEAGDAIARAVWATATHALAFAIAGCVGLVSPEVVVLAGGLAEAGDALVTPVAQRLADLVVAVPVPRVTKATAGEHAGVLGTALRARRHLAAGGGAR